ncbi:hypothetical protein [Bradyrhizobium sp. AUGA SZCCT0283]|uniref:hypothetical protein n=1 Tax=Bradyrhizobium sp. AUGA SZCCT0283 TaxID=2807671 RepID=UPI001BAC7081|nr:hypothetical protein [Bradyrhizobium sp. AUGA SZCCT0283]MBR1277685.1 hypothetical protein [Bradyrhizobium sp. AUGA SZCCT0283]
MPSRVAANSLQSLARIVGTSVLCLAIVFLGLHSLYPSTDATIRFLGYVLLFNLLPGAVISRYFLPGARELGVYLAFSLAVGIVTNILVVTLLWAVAMLQYLFLLPVFAGALGIARLRRSSELLECAEVRNVPAWIFGLAFACFTALLGVSFMYAGTYSDVYTDAYSSHAAFEGVIVRGLEFGYPPANLLFPNAGWSYNYAAHLWLLGVKLTTGSSIDVLVTRFGPAFLGGASAAVMVAFGRYVVGLAWWVAYLPAICVYWIVGIAPISGSILASFMPFGANLILSPFVAFIVFFLTIAFLFEEEGSGLRERCFRFVTLVVLAFLATGARGVCTPILLCGMALRLTVSIWRREGRSPGRALDLVAVIVGFGLGLRFFFTVGTSFSGAGTVKITGQPFTLLASQDVLTLAGALTKWGFAAVPAGIVAFAVIAIFQAAFLTPAVPASLIRMRKNAREVEFFLLGCGIAGLSGFFLTEAPELSHVSFLYFSNISFALLGALGLQLTIHTAKPQLRFGLVSIVAVVLLACLHLAQIPINAIAWIGGNLAASAVSVASLSSRPLPALAPCMRNDDADLFAVARAVSPAAIVIPIYHTTHCAAFWWVVHHPTHTLNVYLLQHVPGRAADPALQAKIRIQQERMFHAWESAAKGILDVSDIIELAKTLVGRGPIFLMAPRSLSIETPERLHLVGASEVFGLWKVSVPRSN